MKKQIIALVLVLSFIGGLFSVSASAAGKYGSMPIYLGYGDVDYMADEILKQIPTAGKSKREQIRAVYDWIIKNCTRYENEWDGTYHFDENAVAAQTQSYIDKASAKVEAGTAVMRQDLESHFGFMPFYDSAAVAAGYAYDIMMRHNGNCLHFASLLTVLLGHLGFDCRIIDGYFLNADGTKPIHKWNYVLVDGAYYWLDVRMDQANYVRNGKINYQYFMISDTAAWERNHLWDHTYSDILRQNAAAVAQLYNDTANKYATAKEISVVASRSGFAEGAGRYFMDETAVIYAGSNNSTPFVGWYDKWGNLVSTDSYYEFTVKNDATYYALFEGDIFADIPAGSWYLEAAIEAYERGYVNGMTTATFEGKGQFTRAMVATILARITGDDITGSPKSPFTDVPDNAWYTDAVNWAYENGIVLGRTETSFAPKEQVTRQEFLTMAVRYLKAKGFEAQPADINYSDKADISNYAVEAMGIAQAIGLIDGYPDGTIKPRGVLTRAEGTTIVLRLADYMEKNSPADTMPDDGQQTLNPDDTSSLVSGETVSE